MISERKIFFMEKRHYKVIVTCCHCPHRTLRRASRCDCTLSPPRCHSRGSDDEKFTPIVSLFACLPPGGRDGTHLSRSQGGTIDTFTTLNHSVMWKKRACSSTSLCLCLWKKRPAFVFFCLCLCGRCGRK